MAKVVALTLSCLVSLLVVEVGLRVAFEAVDFLKPDMSDDTILGWRIVAGSAGHDEWGFRNDEVPETVDTVAIGDSQTYGYSATARESWPSWYSTLSGRSVYSLGIGGYGPAEYLHLLETKALSLQPEQIVVGLYFGNDFYDANQSVSTRPHWAFLRPADATAPTAESTAPRVAVSSEPPTKHPFITARDCLRRNSMLFRVIEEGPIGQRINARADRRVASDSRECVVAGSEPFTTIFKATDRFSALNPEDPAIERGIEYTLRILGRMNDLAGDAELVVLLIPTKESVLAYDLQASKGSSGRCDGVMSQLVAAEAATSARVKSFLSEHGIPFVDPLDAMRVAADTKRIYLRSADSHPNGAGYRVMADTLAAALDSD